MKRIVLLSKFSEMDLVSVASGKNVFEQVEELIVKSNDGKFTVHYKTNSGRIFNEEELTMVVPCNERHDLKNVHQNFNTVEHLH